MKFIGFGLFFFLVLFSTTAQTDDFLTFTSESGIYNRDISLSIEPTESGTKVYISFIGSEEELAEDKPAWVLYREPLYLSALPGEERFYLVRVRASQVLEDGVEAVLKEYNLPYLIDRRIPNEPGVDAAPGEYREDLKISFLGQEEIYYSVNDNVTQAAIKWQGEPVILALDGENAAYFLVQAYAMDAAGNVSQVVSHNYTIRADDPERQSASLEILSPMPGNFANYQMVCIQTRNSQWVRYTLDGSDPADGGTLYNGPLNLIRTGDLTIRAAALSSSGEIMRDSVFFSVRPENRLKIVSDVQNGEYDHSLEIGLYLKEDVDLFYNFTEREPEEFDFKYRNGISVDAIEYSLKYSVLRARAKHPEFGWGAVYRFFYVIDGREQPRSAAQKDSQKLEIVTDVIRVNTDHIQATNMPVTIVASSEQGRTVVYEIAAGSLPPAPSSISPVVKGPLYLQVPYGMETVFNLKFASIDELGSVAMLEEPVQVVFDRKPPILPEFSFPPGQRSYDTGVELVLTGEGKFEYEVTDDGTIPPDPAEGSSLYEGQIDLSGTAGKVVDYYLKIRARDELGNASVPFGPFFYRIDLRPPVVPQIVGIKDGGVYNREAVSLSLLESNVHVHYTVGADGEVPDDPTVNSPLLDRSVEFSGVEGSAKSFQLKLLPFSQFYQLRGDVQPISFRIDLDRPDPPQVTGFDEGARYDKPVLVSYQPAEDGDKVFVSFTTDSTDPPDPVTFGILYTEPLSFDVTEGKELKVELRSVSVSSSGNRAYPDRHSRFTIDKKPPPDPQINGIPEGGVSREAIRIHFEAPEGNVYYSLTEDGSLPRLPLAHPDNLYNSVIQLLGQVGEEITYRIVARAVDDLGNASSDSTIHSVLIDKKGPDAPAAPEILDHQGDNGGSTIVAWKVPIGHKLYYSTADEGAEFQLYAGPFVSDQHTITLAAYLEDTAGNRSPESSFTSTPARRPASPKITGVEDGGVYNRRVVINLQNLEGRIRYELTVDGTVPPDATHNSPLGRPVMSFDCQAGESLVFRLTIRLFHPERQELFSDPVSLRFAVDKSPPVAPKVVGVEDSGYYLGARRIELESVEGQIMYAFGSDDNLSGDVPDSSFVPYVGPINLAGRDGAVTPYGIQAFTVDTAGNRSQNTRKLSFAIDRKGIYVSTGGNDEFDGTRESPFRTIEKAMIFSLETGRKIIYLSKGEFELDTSLQLSGNLLLQGGLDPENWREIGDAKSIIMPAEDYDSSGPLLRVTEGSLVLDNFELRDTESRTASPLLELSAGYLEVTDSMFVHNYQGIVQLAGELVVRSSVMKAENARQGFHIRSGNAKLSVSGSQLDGPVQGGEFTLVQLESGTSAKWEKVIFRPGKGKTTRSIYARDVEFSFDDCVLSSGAGSSNAVGLDVRGSNLSLKNCLLLTEAAAHYSAAILAENSEIRIENTRFELAGRFGAVGLKAKGGSTDVRSSIFAGEDTLEFLYLVNLEQGRSLFYNNILLGGQSDDSVSAFLVDGEAHWFNNTLLGGIGGRTTWGFYIKSAKPIRIINNIVTRKQSSSGVAVRVYESEQLELKANCFSGWEGLLQKGDGRRSLIRDVRGLNNLDGEKNGGSIHRNIDESPFRTFRIAKGEDFHLDESSACVNSGLDLSEPDSAGPIVDMEGEMRPALHIGLRPQYDIGADEYH